MVEEVVEELRQSSSGSVPPVVIVQALPQFYSQADRERDAQIAELSKKLLNYRKK